MNGKNGKILITDRHIEIVINAVKNKSIREAASDAGISYFAAWSIINGKKYKYSPIKCPITGYEL